MVNNKCLMWTDKEVLQCEEIIAEMEKKTSGEIVVVIKKDSLRLHLLGPFYFLISFILMDLLVQEISWSAFLKLQSIGSNDHLILKGLALLLAAGVTYGLTRFSSLQFLLVSGKDLHQEIFENAELEFYRNHLAKTQAETGVLIFISLREKKAIILADKAISAKVKQEVWDQILQQMLKEFKQKKFYQGLSDCIRSVGQVLGEHFPIGSSDKNELPNKIIFKSF